MRILSRFVIFAVALLAIAVTLSLPAVADPPPDLGGDLLPPGPEYTSGVPSSPDETARRAPLPTCTELQERPAEETTLCNDVDSLIPRAGLGPQERATASDTAGGDWCLQQPDGQWHHFRFDSCRVVTGQVILKSILTGQTTGSFFFAEISYVYTSPQIGRTRWAHRLSVNTTGYLGSALSASVTISAACGQQCTAISGTGTVATNVPLLTNPSINRTAIFESTEIPLGQFTSPNNRFTYTYTAPNLVTPVRFDVDSPHWRCDNAAPGLQSTGCVYREFTPSIGYNFVGEVSEFARHVRRAQTSGLPGSSASGQPLHRLVDGWSNDQNNRTACPGSWTRPPGQQCDEYPFKSVYEGAFTGGFPAGARTFDNCNVPLPIGVTGPLGWSSCMISAQHNQLAGSQLSAFYQTNRIVNEEPFWVEIIGSGDV